MAEARGSRHRKNVTICRARVTDRHSNVSSQCLYHARVPQRERWGSDALAHLFAFCFVEMSSSDKISSPSESLTQSIRLWLNWDQCQTTRKQIEELEVGMITADHGDRTDEVDL